MIKIFSATLLAIMMMSFVSQNEHQEKRSADPKDLVGRWDLTVNVDGKASPSWMEVKISGFKTLVGYYVAVVGSARPVSHIHFNDGKFRFNIPPQWEEGNADFVIEGELAGGKLTGTVTTSEGKKYNFTGVRAPLMKRDVAPVWGSPIKLFNGKNMAGWKALGKNQWVVKNGILTNPGAGSNLITEQKFDDFKLHAEFRYPKGSNSGIYLRGRHEVQIEDSPKDAHPSSILFGGVYGFIAPTEMATKGADQWQTYDITLIGRRVTIVANGKTIVLNQEIPGPTGGALDSNEGEPGPIYLQGDHGPVEFRNITITPAK